MERFFDESVESKVHEIVFGSKEWRQLDAGEITRAEANAIMLEKAREAGCLFEVQSVQDDWMRTLKTRRKSVEIIKPTLRRIPWKSLKSVTSGPCSRGASPPARRAPTSRTPVFMNC